MEHSITRTYVYSYLKWMLLIWLSIKGVYTVCESIVNKSVTSRIKHTHMFFFVDEREKNVRKTLKGRELREGEIYIHII